MSLSVEKIRFICYLQSTIREKEAVMQMLSHLIQAVMERCCDSQVLNSLPLQAENLFCRQPVWKASVIKGFSFCVGRWQYHRGFSELKEGERKKSFTNWRSSRNSAAISASHDEKPIKERFVNYFCSLLYAVAFSERLVLCLIYLLCWHVLLAPHTITN